jgi:hypothetical protein
MTSFNSEGKRGKTVKVFKVISITPGGARDNTGVDTEMVRSPVEGGLVDMLFRFGMLEFRVLFKSHQATRKSKTRDRQRRKRYHCG